MPKKDEIHNSRLLPSMLVAARRDFGGLQKAVALDAGLDQSYLCALERGRRPVPRHEVLEALGVSLNLDVDARRELAWAAAHDRVLSILSDEGLAEYAGLLSSALRAAHCLSQGERAGLEQQLLRSVNSKQHLLTLAAQALSQSAQKENVMT